MATPRRKPYPSDVGDEAWHVVLPSLTPMRADAPHRHHDLREGFNARRWVVRTGAQWAYLPHEFPVWTAVYQQARRGIAAGVFAARCTICGRSCASRRAGNRRRLRRSSLAARGNRPR